MSKVNLCGLEFLRCIEICVALSSWELFLLVPLPSSNLCTVSYRVPTTLDCLNPPLLFTYTHGRKMPFWEQSVTPENWVRTGCELGRNWVIIELGLKPDRSIHSLSLFRVSNVRYVNPLWEVYAGAKLNVYSADPPHPKTSAEETAIVWRTRLEH